MLRAAHASRSKTVISSPSSSASSPGVGHVGLRVHDVRRLVDQRARPVLGVCHERVDGLGHRVVAPAAEVGVDRIRGRVVCLSPGGCRRRSLRTPDPHRSLGSPRRVCRRPHPWRGREEGDSGESTARAFAPMRTARSRTAPRSGSPRSASVPTATSFARDPMGAGRIARSPELPFHPASPSRVGSCRRGRAARASPARSCPCPRARAQGCRWRRQAGFLAAISHHGRDASREEPDRRLPTVGLERLDSGRSGN